MGAACASLLPGAACRARVALALAGLAIVPDLDVVGFAFDIPYAHPFGHRGFSHSLAFAALAGVASAPLVRRLGARRSPWLAPFLAGVIATHGVLDALTDGGLGVAFFFPLSDRFFFPIRPLAVSPLGLESFVTVRGLRVLAFEAMWVWLPLASLFVAAALWRSRCSSRGATDRPEVP